MCFAQNLIPLGTEPPLDASCSNSYENEKSNVDVVVRNSHFNISKPKEESYAHGYFCVINLYSRMMPLWPQELYHRGITLEFKHTKKAASMSRLPV